MHCAAPQHTLPTPPLRCPLWQPGMAAPAPVVTLLLFAAAKEAAGTGQLTVPISAGSPATVSDVLAAAAAGNPGLTAFLETPHLLALDQEFVEADATIPGPCEVALMPPVSGG